jgi:hypothetical protein
VPAAQARPKTRPSSRPNDRGGPLDAVPIRPFVFARETDDLQLPTGGWAGARAGCGTRSVAKRPGSGGVTPHAILSAPARVGTMGRRVDSLRPRFYTMRLPCRLPRVLLARPVICP